MVNASGAYEAVPDTRRTTAVPFGPNAMFPRGSQSGRMPGAVASRGGKERNPGESRRRRALQPRPERRGRPSDGTSMQAGRHDALKWAARSSRRALEQWPPTPPRPPGPEDRCTSFRPGTSWIFDGENTAERPVFASNEAKQHPSVPEKFPVRRTIQTDIKHKEVAQMKILTPLLLYAIIRIIDTKV